MLFRSAIGYPRTKTGHQRFFVEYDPDRGWRNVPGASGLFSTDEYDVELQYNSHGIRGPERTTAKPDGLRRVVVLGDSFIEGYSVPREQRVAIGTSVDPVMLEIFNNLFMSIAEQMGLRLQNTAYSVNIKERLDFSCALFDEIGRAHV